LNLNLFLVTGLGLEWRAAVLTLKTLWPWPRTCCLRTHPCLNALHIKFCGRLAAVIDSDAHARPLLRKNLLLLLI